MEAKETLKTTNPYARPHLLSVSSATYQVIDPVIVLLGRQYTWSKEKKLKPFVSQMEMEKKKMTMRMMTREEII